MSRIRLSSLILTIAIPGALMAPGAAQAAVQLGPDYYVNSFSDGPVATQCQDTPGDCTLRQALGQIFINNPSGPYVGHVHLPPGTYTLDPGEGGFELSYDDIEISSDGPAPAEIVAPDNSLAFFVYTIQRPVDATLNNLTIKHGAGDDGPGVAANVQLGNGYNLTINDSTITNNTVPTSGVPAIGAGISVAGDGGTTDAVVNVNNSEVSDNTAFGANTGSNNGGGGGGIGAFSGATVNITDSSMLRNTAEVGTDGGGRGGGIYAANSELNITNSTVGENTAKGAAVATNNASTGGGMELAFVDADISGSTISGNTAEGAVGSFGGLGGGMDIGASTVAIANSTITGNTAGGITGTNQGAGGAIIGSNASVADMTNVTLASNTAQGDSSSGGNIAEFGSATWNFTNTIVSGGIADDDGTENCSTSGASTQGRNIESLDTCHFDGGDLTNTDPGLSGLANNGGGTQTMAIASSGPAHNAAVGCPTPSVDQRGTTRPQGLICDIGAFELAAANPTMPGTASAAVTLGGAVHDVATLAGGSSVNGDITFTLYGPNDTTCSNPAVFTDTKAAVGNAGYQSASFTPTAVGTYRWIASYSGNGFNNPVTGVCNAPGQSVTVTAVPVVPPVTPPADSGPGDLAPVAPTISLKTAKAKKGTMAIDATTSGAGSITAKQDVKKPLVGPVTVEATQAGTFRLTLKPNKAGNKKLKKLKKSKKLKVEITVSFKVAGSSGFVTKKTFGQLAGKK